MLPEEVQTTRQTLRYKSRKAFAQRLGISTAQLASYENGYKMKGSCFEPIEVPLFMSYACGWLLLTGDRSPPWTPDFNRLELNAFVRKSEMTQVDIASCLGVSDRTLRKIQQNENPAPAYFDLVIAWLRLYGPLNPYPMAYSDRNGTDMRPFESDF